MSSRRKNSEDARRSLNKYKIYVFGYYLVDYTISTIRIQDPLFISTGLTLDSDLCRSADFRAQVGFPI